MKKNKSKNNKARLNRTAHRRAIEKPEVAKIISELKREASKISRVEYAGRLLQLANLGCSTRGLHKALGQSPTSIVRYLTLARLSPQDRAAVQAGASAKKMLAREQARRRQQRLAELDRLDRETGAPSEELATFILEFCEAETKNKKKPISRALMENFLEALKLSITRMEQEGLRPRRFPNRLPISQLLRAYYLKPQEDEFWLAHHARWLAELLKSRVENREILRRAITKAKNKANQSEAKRTPLEMWQQRAKHMAELSSSPSSRNPPKPMRGK